MSEAPAADYTICILETLARSHGLMGISDISRETGINKNAVSRVLGALTDSGWIYQDGVKYQLTLKPFRIVSSALGRNSFFTAAQPVLQQLWEETGDSCYIGILKNDAVLYLGHIDSTRDLKIAGRVGGSYPLATTAPGKVLLAYADASYRERYMREVLRYSSEQCEAFEQILAVVRRNGWAMDVEEYGPGIICFAAPVFDLEGRVAGTIGVSTSTVYCSKEELMVNQGRKVIDAARKLSEKLGAEL